MKRKKERSDESSNIKKKKIEKDVKWWKKIIQNKIFNSLLNDLDLTDHHTASYNDFVNESLKNILMQYGDIVTEFGDNKYELRLSNYKFIRQDQMPSCAHQYNSSYCGTILVDIHELILTKKNTKNLKRSKNELFPYILKDVLHEGKVICDGFPIMLLSSVCHLN